MLGSTDLSVLNFLAIVGVECVMIYDTLRNIYVVTEKELLETYKVVTRCLQTHGNNFAELYPTVQTRYEVS
jgi:hypothetical protein